MRLCRPLWISLATAALGGCAAPIGGPPITDEALVPVLCREPEQCALMWRRAQAWVGQKSDFRIQAVTDTILHTYGPTAHEDKIGFQVTRVPNGRDFSEIIIRADAGTGAYHRVNHALLDFRRYLLRE